MKSFCDWFLIGFMYSTFSMDLTHLLKKYNFQIKYGLLIVTIFSMIAAIRVYINYLNVEISIENTKNTVLKTQEEIDYLTNFYEPYLQSSDAQKFFAHENNILLTGEVIIKFTKPVIQTGTIV